MLHSEWNNALQNAISEETDFELENLLTKTKLAASGNVGCWQIWQVLRILVDRKKNRQDQTGYLALSRQLADSVIEARKEIEVVLGTACADFATELISSEMDENEARNYARIAFESLGSTLDPSPSFNRLIDIIRMKREEDARKKK